MELLIKGKMIRDIEECTLDDELPIRSRPKPMGEQSLWRRNYNKKHLFVMPDADDVRKIKRYVNKGVGDEEIAEYFKISYKILSEIKNGEYYPYKDRKNGPVPKIGRLSIDDVKEARQYIKDGISDEEISKIFGVCKKAIFNLRKNKSWTSVEEKS